MQFDTWKIKQYPNDNPEKKRRHPTFSTKWAVANELNRGQKKSIANKSDSSAINATEKKQQYSTYRIKKTRINKINKQQQ